MITAARALSAHPSSKIATENLEVFVDMWQWLASDVSSVSKEVIELAQAQSRPQQEYLSLPRPGVRFFENIFLLILLLIKNFTEAWNNIETPKTIKT